MINWFICVLIFLTPLGSEAKTVFIDIIGNYSYFDVSKGLIPDHINRSPQNKALLRQFATKDKIYLISEFSGIGHLPNLDQHIKQIKTTSFLRLDYPFLLANQVFGAKTDDFFFSLEFAFLNFFTTHPWQKYKRVQEIIDETPLSEEVVVYTTSLKTGLSTYSAILKKSGHKKVSYRIKDLNLQNTILKDSSKPQNKNYIIYDSVPECIETFNVLAQLTHENSNRLFIKSNKFSEKLKSLKQASKKQLETYRNSLGCI